MIPLTIMNGVLLVLIGITIGIIFSASTNAYISKKLNALITQKTTSHILCSKCNIFLEDCDIVKSLEKDYGIFIHYKCSKCKENLFVQKRHGHEFCSPAENSEIEKYLIENDMIELKVESFKIFKNKKNQLHYEVLFDRIYNATNSNDGQQLVLYCDINTKQMYAREIKEFKEKFECVSEDIICH